jgi:hypothetical protein
MKRIFGVASSSRYGFDGTRILQIRHGLKGFLCLFWIKKDFYFKKIEYFFEIYLSRFSNGELLICAYLFS